MSEYQIAFAIESNIGKLYQALKKAEVKDSDLDQGYSEADYVNKKVFFKGKKDQVIQEEEVLDYALEHYERFHLALKEMGYVIPWSLDDFDPKTTFDQEIRDKILAKINYFRKELKKAGYTDQSSDRYKELLAACVLTYVVAGKKGAHGVKVRTEDLDALRRAGLFGVAYNTLEEGGLGLADSEVDCDPEATALEALAGKCGVCTERSYITYGALRMAGLKASSLYIEAPRAYLDEMGLPPEATHNSLIQQTKNKKILDPGLGRFDAESHYKEKSFRWVQESNREWLGFYYMLRANHYRNKNADEKLVEHYRKAQELNPNYFDISRNLAIALHNRAVDLMNDKKYPDALAKLNEARATLDSYLKKRPDDKRPLPIIKQIEETRKLLRDQFPE